MRWWVASIAVMGAATVFSVAGHAQKGRAEVSQGNRLYDEGRYPEAHEKYLDALRKAPDSPLIRFNDGNALYRTEEFERALEAYRQATEGGDSGVASQAWYNLGNAYYRGQQLEGALEAYKEALRIDPTDRDAKHNLELVLEQMQQQQQQQQQDQEQDQEPNEDQRGGEGERQELERQEQQRDEKQSEQQQQQQQQQQGGEPPPQPGQMTREEAERLLQAIQEDPGELRRQRVPQAARRKPKKDW